MVKMSPANYRFASLPMILRHIKNRSAWLGQVVGVRLLVFALTGGG